MIEIAAETAAWFQEGRRVALAVVLKTWGSSPRRPGAKMAVNDRGAIAGSVSAGCVEGAVVEAAAQVIESGRPQYLHFGVADETAWEVGLACGGEIDVFVQPLDPNVFASQHELLAENRAYATLTLVAGQADRLGWGAICLEPNEVRPFRQDTISLSLLAQATNALAAGKSGLFETAGQVYFIDVQLPAPSLVVIGAVHITIPLVTIANALGFETIVIDPRRAFANDERFPHADRLIRAWPDAALAGLPLSASTAVIVLTHDPKLDDPALLAALPSAAFYVGALGSRKTQKKRRGRLAGAGLTAEQIDRLHGPVGLEIGGQLPEEIALAIMAEIVQTRRQGEKIFPLVI